MLGAIEKSGAFLKLIVALAVFWWPMTGEAELVDRIVAIVNEDAVTLSELDEEIEPFVKQIQGAPYGPDEKRQLLLKVRQDMLNRIIDQRLTDQESKRLGVSIDESEIDKRVDVVKNENFITTDEDLNKALEAEGYSLEEYRKKIKEQLLSQRLVNMEVKSKVAITGEEISEYYENHKKDYGGATQYHLRTVLIRVSSWEKAEEKDMALERMNLVVEALNSGTSFPKAAMQYSEDLTAKDGGDLGLFTIEELAPELQETVRWMEEGEVSSILQTSQGYQLLFLEETRSASGKTLEEARAEIQQQLYREEVDRKYKAWLETLRERSYIKVIQ
jgi:peptidyl-prolyl cis-trans isomerase SurA